jgi:hypothetical protein
VTLVEFLLARLAEDEAVARGALDAPTSYGVEDSATEEFVRLAVNEGARGEVATHITRHDPARVLAEVAAKRRIVALHSPGRVWTGSKYEDGKCLSCLVSQSDLYGSEYETVPCPTLRLLALHYAGYHPDYQEEWKP